MLPNLNDPVWTQIVTGKKPMRSNKATINLLIHGNKMSCERDPSPANVKQLVAKTYEFFAKYESIFPDEIASILK